MVEMDSAVTVVHALPGRTRLRVSRVTVDEATATRLAEALAALPGIEQVRIDRRTRSILCTHAPTLGGKRIFEVATSLLAVPAPAPAPASAEVASAVAVAVARLFRDLDKDVLQATDGRLGLGTLATFGFV